MIYGSGNANNSFTGATGGGVEVALRAKLRYDINGDPQNIFNYDGDRTYTFDPLLSKAPANRSIFNFEFSINSDVGGTLNRNVNDLDYVLTVDVDPGPGVINAFAGDPVNVVFADHSFGDNTTGNGLGLEAVDPAGYLLLLVSNNVVQNSANLGFGFTPNPQLPGVYTFSLSAADSTGVLAATSIDVVVASAIPEPATIWLFGSMAALLGFGRRRMARG